MGRAIGLDTYKLRFGHRGINQPVQDLRTGRVQITSHNHGFAVAMPAPLGAAPPSAAPPGTGPPGTGAAAVPRRGDGQVVRPEAPPRFETDFGPAAVTHVNLNDGVVEGLRLLDAPAFSVQYHPEAAPGTHDAAGLFDDFCDLMDSRPARRGKDMRRAEAG
jgi:carbamoyl-phosphate synthase small subunit